MERTFVIAWKSKSEPRWGQGKKLFTREEAQALADEMNQDYPGFIHEPFNLSATQVTEPVLEPAVIHVDFQPAAAEFAVEPASQEAVLA
jgi:hypothetical protein